MVWVRKIFGFILVAMAVYFLKTIFPSPLAYDLTLALTLLLAGIYLAWIESTPAKGKVFPFVRNVIGVIFFVLAVYTAVTGVQGYVDGRMTETLKSISAAGGRVTLNAVDWQPYSEESLAAALKTGKPVFIDSTADWCIACHELDAKTYSQPEIIEASRKFVCLRADLTRNNDEKVKAFYKKYAAKGCPDAHLPQARRRRDLRAPGRGFRGQGRLPGQDEEGAGRQRIITSFAIPVLPGGQFGQAEGDLLRRAAAAANDGHLERPAFLPLDDFRPDFPGFPRSPGRRRAERA